MTKEYQIKLAVCDDSQTERKTIVAMVNKYIDSTGYLATIDEFTCGEELLATDVSSYDLIILDIFMGNMNGIQTAKELMNTKASAKIIFCSTSNEFAAESYEVDAFRYLTKPLSEEKLYPTLNRYFQAHTSMQTLQYKCNRMDESILLSDVLWIEANRHKCIIHTNENDIVTTTTFSQFCEQLKDSDFVKPIRYALVSLCKITSIPGNQLTLCDGSVIPISRELRQDVKNSYMTYKMNQLMQKGA